MLGNWFKKSRHFLNQSEVKPKPSVTCARNKFPRASCRLDVFVSSSDWFTEFSMFFVTGQGNYLALVWSSDTQLETAL